MKKKRNIFSMRGEKKEVGEEDEKVKKSLPKLRKRIEEMDKAKKEGRSPKEISKMAVDALMKEVPEVFDEEVFDLYEESVKEAFEAHGIEFNENNLEAFVHGMGYVATMDDRKAQVMSTAVAVVHLERFKKN